MSTIPLISIRLELWIFKMTFDELISDQQTKVDSIKGAHDVIKESTRLKAILRLILAVGNYLNADNKKGEADAVGLDVFDKLWGMKSNGKDFNLLMYIYELAQKNSPEDCDLHKDLDPVVEAKKLETELLQTDIEKIKTDVEAIGQKLKDLKVAMEENAKNEASISTIETNKSDDEKEKKENEDEDEDEDENAKKPKKQLVFPKVEDHFIEIVEKFYNEATHEAIKLSTEFQKVMKSCNDLAVSFGEKADIKPEEFFGVFETILDTWAKARKALDKITAEERKKQKMMEKKNNLKAKLEKRPTRDNLQHIGIMKSSNDIKKDKRKRTICEELINGLLKKNYKRKINIQQQNKDVRDMQAYLLLK